MKEERKELKKGGGIQDTEGRKGRERGRESQVLKFIFFFPALINNLRNRREGGMAIQIDGKGE